MSYSQVSRDQSSATDNPKGTRLSDSEDEDPFLIDSGDESDHHGHQDSDAGFIQPDQPIPSQDTSRTQTSSATMAAAAPPPPPPRYSAAAGERFEQRRFMGGDTLDEPISATLWRDLKAVGFRLRQVIWYTPATSLQSAHPGMIPNSISNTLGGPGPSPGELHQEWDLWGPLIFGLLISLCACVLAPAHQTSLVFSGVFVLIWAGQATITLNIKLLGGSISYFGAMCVTGYCLFPIVIAALVSSFVKLIIVRVIVDALMVIWAVYAASRGLADSGVLPSRIYLATFPVGLFFTALGWLCVIS